MLPDLRDIKDRLDLVALFEADGHVLKRAGGRMVCLSPFKQEKTASCYVDPAKQRFHCFSSGASGDVFDYAMLAYGIDFGHARELLAAKAGLSAGSGRAMPLRPARRAEVVEEKRLEALVGEELERWRGACQRLAGHAGWIGKLAAWRGFLPQTITDLARAEKIGVVELTHGLRRQDPDGGADRVAFPVEAPGVGTVAYHVRLRPRDGGKASWRFCPSGVGAWPYVLGAPEAARLVVVCEGQWDAMAFYDALVSRSAACGLGYGMLAAAGLAIVGVRGAQNWRLFFKHYLLPSTAVDFTGLGHSRAFRLESGAWRKVRCSIAQDRTALVVCDADAAGDTWTTPLGDEPSFCDLLRVTCKRVVVREPREGFGKDVNDVLRAVTTAA